MSEPIHTVPLTVPGGAALVFLRAELPAIAEPIFALVRYTWNGAEPECGLRLDLQKEAVLDHFEPGSPEEAVLLGAIPAILAQIGAARGWDVPPPAAGSDPPPPPAPPP